MAACGPGGRSSRTRRPPRNVRLAAGGLAFAALANGPPASLASGGPNGAGAGAGASAPTRAPNPAPGGRGGAGGGGGADNAAPAPAPVLYPGPCATFQSVLVNPGYFSTFAAVWNSAVVRSCSAALELVAVRVTEVDRATGLVEFSETIPPINVQSGATNQTPLLDNDFAPFNTSFQVEFEALDDRGNVLATASTMTRTGPPAA